MTVKHALWVTGVLAAIALASPGVLTLGVYLIVPGLILGVAPTVFMYLGAFAVLRTLLPMQPGPALNASALLLALLLGWAAAQPFALAGKATFARANLPDIVPASAVRLRGNVRLEMPDLPSTSSTPRRLQCTALCAALLDTPSVESVTLVCTAPRNTVAPITYRLVPKGAGAVYGLSPLKPEGILTDLPAPSKTQAQNAHATKTARDENERQASDVAAAWAVRLATRETLVADDPPSTIDVTIRITENGERLPGPTISRVEIFDAAQHSLFRMSVVSHKTLAAPLRFTVEGSGTTVRMALARDWLRRPETPGDLQPITALFSYTSLARPSIDALSRQEMLRQLDVAIADPSREASDPVFTLAETWFRSVAWGKPLPREDVPLLARAVADPRIPITRSFYDGSERNVAPELRAALGTRILHRDTPSAVRRQLAVLLAHMPDGTFATMSADERALLGSGTIRPEAAPFIVRLADRGAASVPDLLQILASDITIEPWARRAGVVDALREAFTRLGPQASRAAPTVSRLVLIPRSPLMNDAKDRREWYFALVRMGVAPESLDYGNNPPDRVARDVAMYRKRAAEYEPAEYHR